MEGLRAAAGLAPTFLHSLMGEGAEITEDFTQVGTNLPRVEEEKGEGEIRAEPLIPLVNGEGARMEVWWPSDWWERGGASERVATKDLQNLSSKVSGFEKEFLVKVNVFLAHL